MCECVSVVVRHLRGEVFEGGGVGAGAEAGEAGGAVERERPVAVRVVAQHRLAVRD